jgi:exosortase
MPITTQSTANTRVIESRPEAGASTQQRWLLIWFGVLFLASYAVVLGRLAKQWVTDSDMSHGMFVPMLIAYIVWQRWPELVKSRTKHNLLGLVLMLIGAVLLCVGPPSLETFTSLRRLSLVFSLVGLLLYLRGVSSVRILLYPLVLMLLMIPVPGFILERLTFPLQMVASRLAEQMLELSGHSVLREGNILMLPGQTLNVAEACSGLRSVMALTFLGQAYAYLFDSRPWMRAVIAIAVIPIAVFANAIRIFVSAVAGSHNRAWGEGVYHESTGWIVFVVAFVCIVSVHLAIKKLWPEGSIHARPAIAH